MTREELTFIRARHAITTPGRWAAGRIVYTTVPAEAPCPVCVQIRTALEGKLIGEWPKAGTTDRYHKHLIVSHCASIVSLDPLDVITAVTAEDRDTFTCEADRDFAIAAHQDVPDLCDALQAAWREIARLQAAMLDCDFCHRLAGDPIPMDPATQEAIAIENAQMRWPSTK